MSVERSGFGKTSLKRFGEGVRSLSRFLHTLPAISCVGAISSQRHYSCFRFSVRKVDICRALVSSKIPHASPTIFALKGLWYSRMRQCGCKIVPG